MVCNSLKESRNRLLLFFFWLLYFLPLAVEHFEPRTEYIALILRVPMFLIAFSNVAGTIIDKHFHKSSYLFWICLLLAWELLCVLINSPSAVLSLLADIYQIVEVIVILIYCFKINGINGLMPLYYVSLIYILLSFVSMIIYPYGIFISNAASSIERAQWLFGSKNNVGVYLATFSFVVILLRTSKAFLSNLFTVVIVGISCFCIVSSGANSVEFLQGSSTGILMCMIVFVTAMFSNQKLFCSEKHQLLSMNKTIILVLAINFLLIGGLTISFINDFVVNILHKSETFSGRVYIWRAAIEYIKSSPVLGHGLSNAVFYGNTYTSTYNMFLGIMKHFGIPAVLMLFLVFRSVKTSASRNVQIALIGLFTCFINGLMSQVSLNFIVFFLTVIYLLKDSEKSAIMNVNKADGIS